MRVVGCDAAYIYIYIRGASERDGQGDQLETLGEALGSAQRGVGVALDDEREHAAEGLLARVRVGAARGEDALGQLVVRVRGQPRVVQRLDERVGLEHLGRHHGVLSVALHAHVQRAQPSCEEKGLERRERRTDELLHLGDLVCKLIVLDRDRAREDIRVTADVPGKARGAVRGCSMARRK